VGRKEQAIGIQEIPDPQLGISGFIGDMIKMDI
jgi:hypothetical protein